MKNKIRILKRIMFLLFIALGLNAFTSPSQHDSIMYDITEGKIQATEADGLLTRQMNQAQQDYTEMNIRFDALALQSESTGDSPRLSGLSQVLYVYDQEVKAVKLYQLDQKQQKAFFTHLASLKKEFYTALAAVSEQK
tara:strand:- start:41073 stop:41486 length:414 start_codon:yes stop_codon:yes gene_type:complete